MDMNGINNLVFKCLLQSVGSTIGLGIVYVATKALGSNVEPIFIETSTK